MNATEHALLSFFEQVAQKDQAQLAKLRTNPRFGFEQGCWSFTLPDLHSYLRDQHAAFNQIDYKQFRKMLFACPINQVVKPLGAEITITDNRAKVDQSRYALVWKTD